SIALDKPPFPVIFIHGILGSASTWYPSTGPNFVAYLHSQGWTFGGIAKFQLLSGTVTSIQAGDFYVLEFSDNQSLTFDEQGSQLSKIISAVLAANPGLSKVILVGHSMGGLAARAYLQFQFRDDV